MIFQLKLYRKWVRKLELDIDNEKYNHYDFMPYKTII